MTTPSRRTVLFLCTGNSARSQMAEGFGRVFAPEGTEVVSAGTEPKGIHPRAIQVMDEVGVDIRPQRSQDIEGIDLESLELVVTLCGSADRRCPPLPAGVAKEHWPLPDPAAAEGAEGEVVAAFHSARDEIRHRVEVLMEKLRAS